MQFVQQTKQVPHGQEISTTLELPVIKTVFDPDEFWSLRAKRENIVVSTVRNEKVEKIESQQRERLITELVDTILAELKIGDLEDLANTVYKHRGALVFDNCGTNDPDAVEECRYMLRMVLNDTLHRKLCEKEE